MSDSSCNCCCCQYSTPPWWVTMGFIPPFGFQGHGTGMPSAPPMQPPAPGGGGATPGTGTTGGGTTGGGTSGGGTGGITIPNPLNPLGPPITIPNPLGGLGNIGGVISGLGGLLGGLL